MTFIDAVQSCLSQYAVFRGRAPRSEFWWFYLFTVLVEIAAMVIGTFAFGHTMMLESDGGPGPGWFFFATQSWLPMVAHLLLILPSLAVTVRRLHDVGRSGWWVLIAFVPLGILVLLYWWVQPSEPRSNAHGPSPAPLAG